ncbi:helix-turn-helix domain-containing protein [Virgisporangium aurantiacum]|uniref:Transcriptional regulator n=1 Tax=Virgisporangium aurantiacum TaxID=175570 RepID=A0A8J3Z4W6_9ACTN|nr:helix-turn-helix transcriptional regulator [Virgisporangium aurantiacum]GIJ56373.1 transcriptional regulator [Virgisporangium aurantiacum]
MVQRRRLRADLQEARLRLGLTQRQVAADLGWSISKLLRVENGKVGVSRTDLKALLQLYEVTDQVVIDEYVQMAEQGRKQRWNAYRDILNPSFFRYLEYESSACQIRQFQHVIPGLLQTEAFAREISIATAPNTPDAILDRQLEVRMARQVLLDDSISRQLHFVMDESALRRWSQSTHELRTIMYEQLFHLKQLAARPSITIQIVPFGVGPYRGMHDPFILLSFPEERDDDLLFRERGVDSVASQNNPEKIAGFASRFASLSALALSPNDTTELLDRIAFEQKDP